MKRHWRRLYYLAFAIIFCLLAPIIVLHAAGIRFDRSRLAFIRTAQVVVETDPTSASVFVNGKLAGTDTPLRAGGLLPGDVTVAVKKAGYLPWEQTFTVVENRAYEIGPLTLWLSEQLTPVVDAVSAVAIDESGERLAVATATSSGDVVRLFDTRSGEETGAPIVLPIGVQTLSWSADGKRLLTSAPNDGHPTFTILDLETATHTPLSALTLLPFERVTWVPTGSDRLVGLIDRTVYLIDRDEQTTVAIADRVDSFAASGHALTTVTAGSPSLLRAVAFDGEDTETITELPGSSSLSIVGIRGDTVAIADHTNRQLTLIKRRPIGIGEQVANADATGISWYDDGLLLFWNDFELYRWRQGDAAPELIQRTGRQITAAAWYPAARTIFVDERETVAAIQADATAGVRTTTTLENGEATMVGFDQEGDALYLTVPDSDGSTLFRRALR